MHQQRVVPDSGEAKELSPREKRECINKEWSQTLVGSKCRAEPMGNEGVHLQRVVPDSGWVKVQSWARGQRGSASTKSGPRL